MTSVLSQHIMEFRFAEIGVDSTEIDEILTLRILTLTDDEKRAMAGVDQRAGALLERSEAMARERLMSLHGTIRGLQPAPRGSENE